MSNNVHGSRNTARPASVSSLAARFTGSTLKGKKSRVSLALAVSLWIATGGTPWAEAAEQVINLGPENTGNAIEVDTNNKRAYPKNDDTWKLAVPNTGDVWADYTAYGRYESAGGGEFTLESGKIKSAYGVYTAQSYTNATSGKVTISGGTVTNDVFGGYTANYGDATDNTVTISGGEVTNNVYGGYGRDGNANNNTVTINGNPTFGTDTVIYGGYALHNTANHNTANNNTININAEVTVEGINVGQVNDNTTTGNTLNLGATGITVGSTGVKNTQTIAITSDVPFTDGATVLSSTTGGIGTDYCNNVTLDVTGLTDKTTPGTMTLLHGKNGDFNGLKLKYSSTIGAARIDAMQGTTFSKSHTNTAIDNGVNLNFDSNHTVKRMNSKVTYNIANTVTGINLNNWKYAKGAYEFSSGWTGSNVPVNTGNFSLPNETTTILTANTANFFGTVTGGKAYIIDSQPPFAKYGITMSHYKVSGVKAEAYNGLANAKLTFYASTDIATRVTLDGIEWNTSAPAWSNAKYTFNADTVIDASNLTFTGMERTALKTDGTSKMTLLSGVTGGENVLPANITQPSAGKGTIAVDYTNNQNINFTATASGAVSVGTDKVDYTINKVTLSGVDLSNWNGTASTVPTGWTAKTGLTVATYDMTVPTGLNPGATKDILTGGANLFAGATINGEHKWTAGGALDTTPVNGVALTGAATGTGVKADDTNTKLLYQQSKNIVSAITLGETTFTADGTARTLGNTYDAAAAAINADGLTFTEASQKAMNAGDAMTILDATAAIKDGDGHALTYFATEDDYALKFEDSIEDKVLTLTGSHTDTLSQDDDRTKLTYTVGAKKVIEATLAGDIAWVDGGTYYTNPATKGYTFSGTTVVDIKDVNFTATADPLTGSTKTMTLIENAAGAVDGKISGTPKFDVTLANTNTTLSATATGEASMDGNDLKYTVNGVTLDKVTVKSVGDTADAVPTGWTANASGVSVTADSSFAPNIGAGKSKDILTATDGFFSDAQIADAIRYKADEASSDTTNGVTLTGAESKGVKVSDDGKNLVYARSNFNVSEISLGDMTWGKERALSGGCDFNNVANANISASNLKFSNPDNIAKNATTTLLSGATNLKTGENIAHTQDFTKTVNGATLSATLSGSVIRTTAEEIGYTATGTTLDAVDLANWNGTAASVPEGWTAKTDGFDVTGSFTAPTIAAGTSKDVLTATDGIFTDAKIDDAIIYKQRETFGDDTAKGVTLSGVQSKGVKTADNGKSLVYAAGTMDVRNISFGEMVWNEGRAATMDYDFTGVTEIDATGLKFTKPEAVTDSMTLLSGATNLATGATITGAGHTQNFTETAANGVKLSETLSGTVSKTTNTVDYAVTGKTLNSVNLAGWDSTKAAFAVPAGWTANLGANSVTADGFTAPTIDAGGSTNILTAGSAIFNDNQITGAMKYKADAASSDTASGVTLTGAESKGVKASDDGKSLVYARSNFDVNNIAFGEMTWGTSRDGSGAGYNYAGAKIDASGLEFAGWKPEETAANASAILLSANGTLPDFTAVDKSYSYAVAPASGVTVDGAVNGSVSKSGNNIVFTATENKASKLTFGAVNWLSDGALIDHKTTLANVSFDGADVDTAKISFTGVNSLDKNDKMTLVSDFGTAVGTVTGDSFTLGSLTGKGNAYWENNDLLYVVTEGTSKDEPTDNDAKDSEKAHKPVSGETVEGNISGGDAKNDGVATDNTATVEKNSTVKGDVTGATSEGGTASENKAVVSDSEVTGNVAGAHTDNGVAKGNTANVTGGTVTGDVAGAQSKSGTVSNGNTANVKDANVGGSVYGGQSTTGEVNTNIVNLTGGTVKKDVYGGKTDGEEKKADGNQVAISGATVEGAVYGGYSKEGTADANKVEVSGDAKLGDVYGGKSQIASDNNEVTFKGGTARNLIGGGCDTATENTVTVENGKVEESVYGGKAEVDALENHVILSGGTVKEAVYGGWSDSDSGKTQGNSVLLYGEADVHTANIFGGNREATGNTLTIGLSSGNANTPWTGGEQTVRNISNFESIRFAVVPWSESKAAVTITDGTASDLSMSKIDAKKVHFTNVDSLKQSDSMTLLDQSKAAKKATTVEEKSEFTIGSGVQGKGYLSLDKENGNVIYTVGEMGASEQSHNTVMGATVGMAALSAGNDFIGSATEGLSLASNVGADGVSSFAQMGGGSMRQETGSHVDTHTWNAILALGHQNKKERGTMEYGAFFEYGTGNYTTHNGDERGDGSTKYTGGGVLAKWTAKHGFYVEGSFRAGTVHDDARNVLRDEATHMPYSYETDAGYFGAHIGVGKEISLANGNVVDVYGKYFYNRRNSVNFNVGGDHYDLDAVTSQVLRIGARYTVKRDKWNYYAGVAYEHELDGKATGTANTFAIRSADTSGASFRGEIGATMKPGENSPWQLDLNVAGFAGKKQGFTGGVSVAFMF